MYVGTKEWMDKNIEEWTKNSNTTHTCKPNETASMTARNRFQLSSTVFNCVLSYIFCPFVNIILTWFSSNICISLLTRKYMSLDQSSKLGKLLNSYCSTCVNCFKRFKIRRNIICKHWSGVWGPTSNVVTMKKMSIWIRRSFVPK